MISMTPSSTMSILSAAPQPWVSRRSSHPCWGQRINIDRADDADGADAKIPPDDFALDPFSLFVACVRQIKAADWANPAEVKRDVRSASILKNGRVVFNVAGNKYRIVAWINYPYRVMYIRFVGTYEQYDPIDAKTV